MAALIKSANPGISHQEIRRRLQLFAKDLGPAGRDNDYGYGILRPERDPVLMPDQSDPVASAGGAYVGVVGEPVEFSASGTTDPDDNFLMYTWDFDDGETAHGQYPAHVYARPGNYVATLTVTDQDGRKGKATAEVTVTAGILRSVTLGAFDTGFAREPNSVYHRSLIQAGVSYRQTYYGLMAFDTPMGGDLRVLSAELVLTAATKSPKNEGVITAGLLASEVTENWQTVTYAEIDEAQVTPLDSPIVMSSLHTGVTQGDDDHFSIPVSDLASFEDQFRRGRVAFRMALDTTLSTNRLEWKNPRLIVRYVERPSAGTMAPVADAVLTAGR
jgi:PKD repeat protein